MTLAQWTERWPYRVQAHGKAVTKSGKPIIMWTPDGGHAEGYRALAWQLSDYRVSSVTGGSIWFISREEA